MKKEKGIGLIIVILIIVISIIGIIFLINKNSIENTILTKDNFEITMKKYSEKQKQNDDYTDNYYYVIYAEIYYMFEDTFSSGLSEILTSGTMSEDTTYKNIYGRTLKELKEEGKDLMEKNNITVEEYKKILIDNSNNNDNTIILK